MVHLRTHAILLSLALLPAVPARAQGFGSMQHEKIVLTRKLPPTGHIDGSTFKVVVTASGMPADLALDLKSTVESMIVADDPRLRTDDKADAVITCRITSYSQPPAQKVTEQGLSLGSKKGPLQSQQMTEVTGLLTVNFQAQDAHAGRSIAADTVTAKFDHEYAPATTQEGKVASIAHRFGSLPTLPGQAPAKPADNDSRPPTAAELRLKLVHDTALQIASLLVNTTEQIDVLLAHGSGLDDANRLAEQKLWTRALEQLETMTPFPQPQDDAYRLYNIGVVNEALAYQAEDVTRARKFLQEAAIDYGKAIDARPSEKNFLAPQSRIDTALAHYKTLGDRAIAASAAASANAAAAASAAAAPPPAAGLSNGDVIAMVSAKLDEANILDTIQHADAQTFDLSAQGQIALAKAGVNGRIISAMKLRARAAK